jgi:YVTN family beta-propeller protein
VKRRTEGSAHRHRRSRTASPAVIDRPDGIGNGLIGDGEEPDETGPPKTYIAKILLGDQVSDIVTSPNNSVAYAALSNSIAVISSLHGVSCIILVSGHPQSLRIDADGSRLFASNYRGAVSVIDIVDHCVNVVPGACYVQQVDTADGAFIYAAGNVANGGGCDGWITVADAESHRRCHCRTRRLCHHRSCGGPRRQPGIRRVVPTERYYQYDAGLVGVIDTATNAVVHTIDLGAVPDAITVTQDGSMMYTTHYDHKLVSAVNLGSYGVTPITLGDSPLGVSLTPDGLQAYVTNSCSLSVIDTVANEAAQFAVGDLPRCVRISPDGKHAYVSNFGDGSVSVIDTIAQCVTDTVDAGGHPEALAVSPDGHHLYVGDYWSGTVSVFSVQP